MGQAVYDMTIYGTPNGVTTVKYQNIAEWTYVKRLEVTLQLSLPLLGPEVVEEIKAILSPESLAIMAGVLVGWIASHAFGLGEIIDVILLVLGVAAMGLGIFAAIDHFYDFAVGVYKAKKPADLHAAADHFAKFVAVVGIQVALALLFKGKSRPKSHKGGRYDMGEPPKADGLFYKPKTTTSNTISNLGETNYWGDIEILAGLAGKERDITLLHEKVHRFLRPRFVILRKFRAGGNAASYCRSSLWRYIEEALAETIGQVGVNGFKSMFKGLRFPIEQGYIYIKQAGGATAGLGGAGLLPELKGLAHTAVISGVTFEFWVHKSSTMGDPTRFYEDIYKESFVNDTDIREWVASQSKQSLSGLETGMKASLVNRLFDGWISDDDLKTIDKLCSSISSQDEERLLRRIFDKRTLDVTDLGQRNQVRMIASRWLSN